MDEVDTFIALNRIARQAEALRIESDLNVTGTPRPRQRYEATARAIEALLLDLEQSPRIPCYDPQHQQLSSSLGALSMCYRLAAAKAPDPALLAKSRDDFQRHHFKFVQAIAAASPATNQQLPSHQQPTTSNQQPPSADVTHYQQAMALLTGGLIQEGYTALGTLATRTQSPSLQAECHVAMARLLLNFQTAEKLRDLVASPSDEGKRLLDAVVTGDHYTTVLHEGFMRWRTAQQLYAYGIAHDSPIPNATYNATRDHLIALARTRLQHTRGDRLALHQLRALALCPNVQRTPDRANSALRDDRELNPPIAEGVKHIQTHQSVPSATTRPPSPPPNRGAQP